MYRTRLGHVNLKVRDLDRAVAFYTRFLNLRLTERVGNFAFLSGSDLHHEVALQALGPDAPHAPRHSIGLFHVAFEVPDRRSLALAYKTLTEAGVQVSPVDNVISWALYFADPDGNGLELYWDTRHEPVGEPQWNGRVLPLPPEKLLAAPDDNPA